MRNWWNVKIACAFLSLKRTFGIPETGAVFVRITNLSPPEPVIWDLRYWRNVIFYFYFSEFEANLWDLRNWWNVRITHTFLSLKRTLGISETGGR